MASSREILRGAVGHPRAHGSPGGLPEPSPAQVPMLGYAASCPAPETASTPQSAMTASSAACQAGATLLLVT